MSELPPDFETCLFAVLDGTADEAQHARFQALLHDDPERVQIYVEQAEIHTALLIVSDARAKKAMTPFGAAVDGRVEPRIAWPRIAAWAAAAVLVLTGAAGVFVGKALQRDGEKRAKSVGAQVVQRRAVEDRRPISVENEERHSPSKGALVILDREPDKSTDRQKITRSAGSALHPQGMSVSSAGRSARGDLISAAQGVAAQKQEETAMTKTTLGTASLAVAASVLTGTVFASEAQVVDTQANTHWGTVFTQTVPLRWDWGWDCVPANATQVELTLSGFTTSVRQTFQKPVSNYTWTVYANQASFKEDSVGATLSFLDAGGTALTNLTARLNVLSGAFFGASATAVSTNALVWRKASSRVLLPYDRAWSAKTAGASSAQLSWTYDGTQVFAANMTDSSVGIYPWVNAAWPRGDYRVDLAFDGAAVPTWTAFLLLTADGTVVILQ